MSILEYLFEDSKHRDLRTDVAARSTALARCIGMMNRKRKNEIETLRTTFARLMLVVETQQRILLKKGVCTQAEFDTLLSEIDLEDGSADGQLKRRS